MNSLERRRSALGMHHWGEQPARAADRVFPAAVAGPPDRRVIKTATPLRRPRFLMLNLTQEHASSVDLLTPLCTLDNVHEHCVNTRNISIDSP